MPGSRLIAIAALLLAPVLAGCSSDKPAARPAAKATPLAKIDVATVRLARAEFCDRVPKAAVRRAIGGADDDHTSWGNGDPVDGAGGTGDVGHEIGCSWTGTQGSARAWVFARPVSATYAATLVRQASLQTSCTTAPAQVFGSPALLQTCTSLRGVHRVRRAGLFGDSWVTCEVSGAEHGLGTLADAWCAQIVAALDTSNG